MLTSYNDYISKKHIENIERNPRYIENIPMNELNYELCCVAMNKAAGDYEFFSWLLKKHPEFVDENLCKIAVSASPKKTFSRKYVFCEYPDGTKDYSNLYKYLDPVIKYVPEKFRTVDVCIESAKYDWRTLQFVPVVIQLADQKVCETALNQHLHIMLDDADFNIKKRDKIIFDAIKKSVFERFPNICNGTFTLKNLSSEWINTNPDKVYTILLNHPEQIKLLPKDVRKSHFDIIRAVAENNPEIWLYLSAPEQKNLRNITRSVAAEHPEILTYLYASEQKELVDLVELALLKGKIKLSAVKPSVQVLIPETCVKTLTQDMYETHWFGGEQKLVRNLTPELNLIDLCPKLQNKNADLISKLVHKRLELLKYVDTGVLIMHPEISIMAIENFGTTAYEKIPQIVFDKNTNLYEQLLLKCPSLLPKFPAKYQTRKNWTQALTDKPFLAFSAPVQYVTVEHFKNVFLNNISHNLSCVPPRFRTYEMCEIAVMKNIFNLQDVPDKIQMKHPDICAITIGAYPWGIDWVPEAVQLQHSWLCKMAVTGNPLVLSAIKHSVQRKHPEICRLAMAQQVADFGRDITAYLEPEKLQTRKEAVYSCIPHDVLKEHWNYINNIQGVITVNKSR